MFGCFVIFSVTVSQSFFFFNFDVPFNPYDYGSGCGWRGIPEWEEVRESFFMFSC